MNTSSLKSFAQHARRLLREGVERRLLYWGFDKKGNNTERVESVTGGYIFRGKVSDDTSVPGKWHKLQTAISNTSVEEVVEKAAYTWFNRLMAMKILSKQGYETAQLDYLSDETTTPALLERARRGQYSFLTATEQKRLQPILSDYENEQEAVGILLIGYCHQHPLLQGIFGSIDDYTELLLPDDILTENGFLCYLNNTDAISDQDYKQVELIGWLYQFYISEKKDEVFAGFKQNKKAEAKDIPAATQIFTPNWIVKYLVQNTVGRTWLDAHPQSELKMGWQYLVEPSVTEEATAADAPTTLNIEELTFLDPAVGSGHILVEAFDTLYPMYLAEYYSPEEAVKLILEKNLFGLDLDLRAVQLAQFAVILKAAQYSRTILKGTILPHIYAMPQHRSFSKEEVELFLGNQYINYVGQFYKALQIMEQAHNLGSVMQFDLNDEAREAIKERYTYWQKETAKNFDEEIVKEAFPIYVQILIILTEKFSCIAANPPYMGQKNMNANLKNYVNKFYPLSKSDLFAVFMDVCVSLLKKEGRYGMINMHSWMFLSSYEALRQNLLITQSVENMLHLGPRTFDELSGEVVQSTAFVLKKIIPTKVAGVYYRLINYNNSNEKRIAFEARLNEFSNKLQTDFDKIPGKIIAYWVTDKIINWFEEGQPLKAIASCRSGMSTSDNKRFTREWHEVSYKNLQLCTKDEQECIKSQKKWFPYNKGGDYRKWGSHMNVVVNWYNNGEEIKKAVVENPNDPGTTHWSRRIYNTEIFFKEGLTWSKIAAGNFSIRYLPTGCISDVAGCTLFCAKEHLYYFLGVLNSKLSDVFIKSLSPTINYEVYQIESFPIPKKFSKKEQITSIVQETLSISDSDSKNRETSWNFQETTLISRQENDLENSYNEWLKRLTKDFFVLHKNEEELNRIFIEIYGLQNELTPDVALKDITLLQEELDYQALGQLQRPYEGQLVPVHADVVMQQLISYAVGCFMGRYRLDKPGLHIAHPNPTEEELVPYFIQKGENNHVQFQIDDDAIIPLMGSNGSFTDDMLQRIKEFLTIVWGDDTLTVNLNFLQQQLGKDLDDYLVKDFWKFHTRMYSKKPIYWLFASKKGAFQVLVYMHRMNAYTPAKIRSKYLIPHISWLQNTIREMERNAASLSKTELRKLDTLRKQHTECEEYDLLLKDIADKQISFDLDDGVTKNYALFEGVVAVIK